jgi:hypothetical protein
MRAEGHVDIGNTAVGVVCMERLPAWWQPEDAVEAQFQTAASGSGLRLLLQGSQLAGACGEGLSVQSGNSQSRDTEDNPCWGRRITHHTPSLAARSDGNVSLGCYHLAQVLAHAPGQGAGV